MASASPLAPTYFGHIASTQDALILFELCLSGGMHHVARRPHDRERGNLIKSGNVFIYEEHSSGIKRWTDGVPWSPSRILGNFLVYRELKQPFPPGEKKRAMKRSRRSPGISKPDSYGSSGASPQIGTGYNASSTAASTFDGPNGASLSKETERSLIGSLVDSYGFKDEGLVKKTVSVTVGNVSHHLVSYYTVADVTSGRLTPPSKDSRFATITPRLDLLTKQNFRTPIDETEPMDRIDDRPLAYASNYPQYGRSAYEMTNQSIAHRPLPLPAPHMAFSGQPSGMYNTYGINPTPAAYHTMAPNNAHTNFGSPFAPSQGIYPTVKSESYDLGTFRPQQRYNSVAGQASDMSRGSVSLSSGQQQFVRRASNYDQHSTVDSNLSGMTSSSVESKLTNDSSYSSSQNYYNAREGEHSPHANNNQRFLPTPSQQTAYEQTPVVPSYGLSNNPESKENLWQHSGNTSSGHGHYMNSHQAWTNSGSS